MHNLLCVLLAGANENNTAIVIWQMLLAVLSCPTLVVPATDKAGTDRPHHNGLSTLAAFQQPNDAHATALQNNAWKLI